MWNTSISISLQGGKDSREVAACLCWWTTHATEELSNLENIRGEKKEAVSPQALVASRASASGGTKGRAGKVQHYLSGSPMWKGAGSTWLLVAKWLERSSVEKDLLQVLLDTTLTMTKQCALTAKTVRSLLGADHSPPLSTDEPQLEPKAQCWAPSTRQSCCEFSFCFA